MSGPISILLYMLKFYVAGEFYTDLMCILRSFGTKNSPSLHIDTLFHTGNWMDPPSLYGTVRRNEIKCVIASKGFSFLSERHESLHVRWKQLNENNKINVKSTPLPVSLPLTRLPHFIPRGGNISILPSTAQNNFPPAFETIW